ncbi:MAG: hypothetical protein A2283_12255 [Lentisphaerae bacterium RIFOXYA12_FULL_48_11]|nr:MAG: hypothetical protein A2283_12255 [Lentisphaerae bacterium RIFOXYA12_FULL_48_11]
MKFLVTCISCGCFLICGVVQANTIEFVAHRGASKDAPENTLASLKLGWQQTDSCEIDIRLTKDGQIVLMHDETAKRTTGVDLTISKATLVELRTLDAGSWKGLQWAGEKIPTLTEVLAIQPEKKKLFIEIKCGAEVLPELEHMLQAANKQPDQIVLICFKIDVMKKARKRFPDLSVIWLASPDKKDPTLPKLEDLFAVAKKARFNGLDLDSRFKINADFVKLATDAELQLYVWTVDDPLVARKLVAAGIRGITTNRPEWLRQQLAD